MSTKWNTKWLTTISAADLDEMVGVDNRVLTYPDGRPHSISTAAYGEMSYACFALIAFRIRSGVIGRWVSLAPVAL
jgi:hypothetical protein